ncbi:hypothetical protein ACFVWG_04565 [Kribbella sp. NPDC058245]
MQQGSLHDLLVRGGIVTDSTLRLPSYGVSRMSRSNSSTEVVGT